jgi:hypothetical protein
MFNGIAVQQPPLRQARGASRIGGNVQQAKLIAQPKPVYPPLATQARISRVKRS